MKKLATYTLLIMLASFPLRIKCLGKSKKNDNGSKSLAKACYHSLSEFYTIIAKQDQVRTPFLLADEIEVKISGLSMIEGQEDLK